MTQYACLLCSLIKYLYSNERSVDILWNSWHFVSEAKSLVPKMAVNQTYSIFRRRTKQHHFLDLHEDLIVTATFVAKNYLVTKSLKKKIKNSNNSPSSTNAAIFTSLESLEYYRSLLSCYWTYKTFYHFSICFKSSAS